MNCRRGARPVIRWADLSVKTKIMVSLQAERSARNRRDLDMTIVRRLPEAFG